VRHDAKIEDVAVRHSNRIDETIASISGSVALVGLSLLSGGVQVRGAACLLSSTVDTR
jgi:hypothetical protein